ncbi:hypothetical protein H4V99_001498 [Cryobacterium sp. CG_9.6]|nr:hypothetical protein [Cryobacterium sp. CG_9.6]
MPRATLTGGPGHPFYEPPALKDEGNPARRRTAARPVGVPGQCVSTAARPTRLVAKRSGIATTKASSAYPSTGWRDSK